MPFVTTPWVLTAAAVAATSPITLLKTVPTFDNWVYPFNSSMAASSTASTFSSQLPTGFPEIFDNRDGQVLLMFETAGDVATGLDPSEYTVMEVTITLQVQNDLAFSYDTTPDSYTSWVPARDPEFVPDADPGRAIEMFATGFRNGFTPATWTESSPYSFVGPFGKGVRNTFGRSFDGVTVDGDVSNSVDNRFDPTPIAVGQTDEVAPGELVPAGTTFSFTLDVANPDVQAYLQESLASGRLYVTIASLFETQQQGATGYPRFYTKENQLVIDEIASAATLALKVLIESDPLVFADLNDDGTVDGADLGLLLGAWETGDEAADLNQDGIVDGADLGLLLGAWTI